YPLPTPEGMKRWKQAALIPNAKELDVPLLAQVADEEFIHGIDTYALLRIYKKPIELIVYSDEHHIKWQPAHRAALYARNVDWLDFWVLGKEDPDPAKAAQYQRWRKLREERVAKQKPS